MRCHQCACSSPGLPTLSERGSVNGWESLGTVLNSQGISCTRGQSHSPASYSLYPNLWCPQYHTDLPLSHSLHGSVRHSSTQGGADQERSMVHMQLAEHRHSQGAEHTLTSIKKAVFLAVVNASLLGTFSLNQPGLAPLSTHS